MFRSGVVLLAMAVAVSCASCGTAARPAAVECGAVFPASVGVGGLGVKAVSLPSSAADAGQVVQRWESARWSVEIRWPAGQRSLWADHVPTADDELIGGSQMDYANHVHLFVQSQGDPVPSADIDVLIPHVISAEALPDECQMMRVTVADQNGHVQTLGVRLVPNPQTGPPIEDFGPLIGRRIVLPRPLEPTQISLCQGVWALPTEVLGAPVMPSAPEALRSFLASPASSQVPRPSSWRPFDEISSPAGLGTLPNVAGVRYEHFVAWTQFVSIQVTRVVSGWAVTQWLTGTCDG